MPQDTLSSADDPREAFDLVDEDDRVVGRISRGEAHSNPALLHRSVQVLVFDRLGRVLLQRRSARKDLFPGYYCASASGHVATGDDYAETAARELQEELGVRLPLTYLGKAVVKSSFETEMTALFLAHSDGPFNFHPTETDGGTFVTLAGALSARHDGSLPMTPALIAALDAVEAAGAGVTSE